MKQTLKIKAALLGAAVLVVFLFCVQTAQSEQAQLSGLSTAKPVDNLTLDGTPATAILQAKDINKLCSLIAVECPDEQSEQANIAVISQMIAGTGFEGQEQTIAAATAQYGVNPALLIGIANAESSVGLHCLHNNCFGIMRQGHELRSYPTLAAGITDAARYLREKHHNKGRFTPEEIVNGYVGHPAPHWLINVRKYYND